MKAPTSLTAFNISLHLFIAAVDALKLILALARKHDFYIIIEKKLDHSGKNKESEEVT